MAKAGEGVVPRTISTFAQVDSVGPNMSASFGFAHSVVRGKDVCNQLGRDDRHGHMAK